LMRNSTTAVCFCISFFDIANPIQNRGTSPVIVILNNTSDLLHQYPAPEHTIRFLKYSVTDT
jgi:hypothetical protein